MATKQKVTAIVAILAEAFGRSCTPATYEAYFRALSDVPDELADAAGNVALRGSGSFMPTPGQLRRLAITGGKTYEARADVAWNEFDRAVAHHGGDISVSFSDGLINATVNLMGGWIYCCERTGDDYFVWLNRQFKETYVRLCESGASEELLRPLVGRYQIENHGFPDAILDQLNAYTGHRAQLVATSQPVIQGPADPQKRLEQRPENLPSIEFKRA